MGEKIRITSSKGEATGEVEGDVAHLDLLVATQRGNGWGSRLLLAFERIVRGKGAKQIKVDVLSTPPGAGDPMTEDELRDFYGKNGYQDDGYGVKKEIKK